MKNSKRNFLLTGLLSASPLRGLTGLIAVLSVCAVGASHGALIAYESFDYTSGDVLRFKDGGTGWGSAGSHSTSEWTRNQQRLTGTISSSSLSYNDGTNSLLTSGNSVDGSPVGIIKDDVVDVERNLAVDRESGDFWFSVLMRTSDTARTLLQPVFCSSAMTAVLIRALMCN
jgi:hypothetical protein